MSLTAVHRLRGNSLSLVELVLSDRFCAWLNSPQHGGVGIAFPIATPRGRSVLFPTQGTRVTYVTLDVLVLSRCAHDEHITKGQSKVKPNN